jgi:hypothetical protein
MVDTIEHLEEPRRALARVLRVMKPSAVLVVFTPPYDSIAWVTAERAHRVLTRRFADHISPFTTESLAYLLGRHFQECRVGILNAGLTMYGMGSRPL